MTIDRVLEMVRAERERVADMVDRDVLAIAADNPDCPDLLRLAALVEEVGEVAQCIHDGDDPTCELVQLAGVAVAWLQGIG